jgi:ribosomal protein S18 acetylase RimI-like enzyme
MEALGRLPVHRAGPPDLTRMNAADAEIRLARSPDARAIAEVHVRARRHAYRSLLDPALLAAESADARERMWDRRLSDRDGRCWVAARDGAIFGFVFAAVARDEDVGPRCAELVALYLLPEHTGRGHGRRLVEHLLSELGSRGFEEVVLWVAVENEAAIGFYERVGFTADPRAKVLPFGDTGLRKCRFRRSPVRGPRASGSD